MTRRGLLGLAAASLVVVAACGTADGDTEPAPTTTIAAVEPAATPASTPDCGDPLASYEPTFELPAPGAMPAGTYMEEIQQRGRLVVGVSSDTLLFGFRNPKSGEIEGFDIDVLHAIAEAIFGDPDAIEFKVINYAQRLPVLEDSSVDLVAHTMTINCARWERIAFSTEYYHAGQNLLVPFDSPVEEIEDLEGTDQTVCVAKGSTNIEELERNYPTIQREEVDDLTDCLVLFQQSAVDAITGDNTVMAGFAAQDPFSKPVGRLFTNEPYGVGVSLDHPEMVEFVNLVLEQMREDGRLFDLTVKWLGEPGTEPPPAVYGREQRG